MRLLSLLFLLACLAASPAASATARDDGLDARPYSLVTTRSTPVHVTVLPRLLPVARSLRPPPISLEPVVRIVIQPRQGRATVAGGIITYEPADGFSGRDGLAYSITAAGRTTSARITVDVGDPLRLRGQVVDGGAAAALSATVGSHVFHARAGADGQYALDVIGRGGDMVELESRSGMVVLGSLLGGFERLLGEAGADAVLDRSENGLVQLSGLGTGLAELLRPADGGRPLQDDADFLQRLGAHDAGTLLDMAAVVRLVADGGHPLPAGIGDTRALVRDRQAFEAFVAALAPGLLEEVVAALVEDPALLLPVRAGEAVGGHSILYPAVDGELRLGMVQGQRLVLDADGSGRFHALYATGDEAADWTLADGVLRVRLGQPQEAATYTTWIDGESTRGVSLIDGLDLRLLLRGGDSGRDLYAVTTHGRVHYPDRPGLPDLVSVTTGARLLHRDGVGTLSFSAADIPGTRALSRHGAAATGLGDLDHGTGHALHSFNADGTGSVPSQGTAFTWTVDADGSLLMAFGGTGAGAGEVEVRRTSRDPHKGEGVVATFRLPDGRVKSKFDLSVVRDGSLAFTEGLLARAWRTSFYVTEPRYDTWTDFHVVLDGPDRTGHTLAAPVGQAPVVQPLSWAIEDGAMVARHYQDNAGPRARCTPGVEGCYLRSLRRWVPLAADGDRIYVLEELWHDPDGRGPAAPVLTSQRGNFYVRGTP